MLLTELLHSVPAVCVSREKEAEITSVCCDSRKAEKGCLFIAVRGYQSDGHRFIASAVERGAAAVLAEEAPEDLAVVLKDNAYE